MEEQPIIVKRKKKVVGGHHGGSWKVAFADFATAMMAFFLVLWLTATASPEQKLAVEGYFKDPVGFTEGGSPNPVDLEGSASVINESSEDIESSDIQIEDQVVEELSQSLEQQQMEELFQDLKDRIEQNETLQEFKDQLLIDITSEGLRIQIVDRSQRPMFDSGRDELKYYSQDILFELAKTLATVNNKLSITGHTDSTPFSGRPGYTNWELSADRDLLEIECDTESIGKSSDSDVSRQKASWPYLFGVEAARTRIAELAAEATDALDRVEGDTGGLRWLAGRLVNRQS